MLIKEIPAFKNIHGSLLSDLADKISPIDLGFGDWVKMGTEDHNNPILIVAHGEVKLRIDKIEIATLRKGSVYGELFQDGAVAKVNEIFAMERAVVFKINLMDFYFVLANHHELVQGLIKNITEENKPQLSQPQP